jgi:hypothetical protein
MLATAWVLRELRKLDLAPDCRPDYDESFYRATDLVGPNEPVMSRHGFSLHKVKRNDQATLKHGRLNETCPQRRSWRHAYPSYRLRAALQTELYYYS